MKISLNTVLLTVVILGFVLFNSLFVVHEGERALVTRFAKVLRDSSSQVIVYEPGPHFKWPFVDKVKLLDARIQTLNSNEDRFVTVEKKDLTSKAVALYKVNDTGDAKAENDLMYRMGCANALGALLSEFGIDITEEVKKTSDESD